MSSTIEGTDEKGVGQQILKRMTIESNEFNTLVLGIGQNFIVDHRFCKPD